MRTTDGRPDLAEDSRGRRRRWRRWPGRLLLVSVVVAALVMAGVLAFGAFSRAVFSATCQATASGSSVSFTPEQTANAALISVISTKRGLPPRAATIALATAIQESKLRNLTYGDRDSLGLFQQRPSQGWGTQEQILDPAYSTNTFYDALVKVRDYETRPITEVAQQVQRSGYPEAYADHEHEGRILASALTGHSPAGVGCRLKPVERAADGTAVAADLEAQLGTKPAQDGAQITLQGANAEQAWAAGHWAVARAEAYGIDRVQVGDKVWERSADEGSMSWKAATGAPFPTNVTIRIGAPRG
jgi:hypothetical protein